MSIQYLKKSILILNKRKSNKKSPHIGKCGDSFCQALRSKLLGCSFYRPVAFDKAGRIGAGTGGDSLAAAGQGAEVWLVSIMAEPSFQVETQNAFRRHPFSVIFPGDVDMGTCTGSAFAGRMPDAVSLLQCLSQGYSLAGFHMQIKHIPARPLVAIAIQVKHHFTSA